jgi:hypothetical protein
MLANPRRLLVLSLLCCVCGCHSVPHQAGTPDADGRMPVRNKSPDRQTRNNAASLLYDLLNDEKNVSKVLIIKSVTPELVQLIQSISEAAGDGVKSLEAMAKADPGLRLHRLGLPAGEAAARESSGRTAQHVLLRASGKDFEFHLLLTQVQALGYGTQLAKVASANETNPEYARQFTALGNQLDNLYQLVTDQLRTR